jgi:DNA-nicking Smr family endonuclease
MLRQALRDLFGAFPTLDLHGYGVKDALILTEIFLSEQRGQHQTVVRIVYGKGRGTPGGRGVLRDVVPNWLDNQGRHHVLRYERLPDASGMDGAVKVWLRPVDSRDAVP